jgi:tRNA-dihydrouridine synthase A
MVKEAKFFRLAEHGVRAGAGIDVLREAIALVEERDVAPIAA